MDINKEIVNNSIDPYEHKLLEVFKSCDTDDCGFLDSNGFINLCSKLHLDEAQDQLIECLLVNKTTVTFPEFRDALLTLLDTGLRHSEESRDPSPDREVSPKYIFGQKKYGRRSRPESTDQEGGGEDIGSEETDFDTFGHTNDEISKVNIMMQTPKNIVKDGEDIFAIKEESPNNRSQLQGDEELRSAWERLGVGTDGYLDKEELALVCRAVGMERSTEEIVNEVFSKLDCDQDGRISFDEFLQLFRGGDPSTSMSSSPHHINETAPPSSPPPYHIHQLVNFDVNSSGYMSADSLIEMWEMFGVPGAANLLHDLGFSGANEVSLSLLNNLLDEELRNLRAELPKTSVSPLVMYLSAALSLSHVHVKQLRNNLEQMTGERDKLKSDLSEANHRASLIAQEVDDRHARMERSAQLQVQLLEQRHSDQVKQLGSQFVSEREQLNATNLRLEKKLADVQEEESKLRSEFATLQTEYLNLERENRSFAEQLSDSKMVKKLAEDQEMKINTLQLKITELESNADQVNSLVEELTQLKDDNTKLRDKNDELTMQVESLSRSSNKKAVSSISLEGGGCGLKRRVDSPPGMLSDSSQWSPSPRQGKVRRCITENDLSLDNVHMAGLAICQPLRHSESGLGADLDTLEDSLLFSNCSDSTVSFKIGSDASKEVEVEKLQARIIELERRVEEYSLKLAKADCETSIENKIIATKDKSTCCELKDFKINPEPRIEMEIQTSIEDPMQVDKLQRHCEELESVLREVKVKIIEILNDKKFSEKENSALKEKIKLLTNSFTGRKSPANFNDGILWESSHEVESADGLAGKYSNARFVNDSFNDFANPSGDDKLSEKFNFNSFSQFSFEIMNKSNDSTIFATEKIPVDERTNSMCLISNDSPPKVDSTIKYFDDELEFSESKISNKENDYINRLANLEKENKELMEECNNLKSCLEMMKEEYEKCEEYWRNKLEDERKYYDEEKMLNDSKFSELECKIREYGAMFADEADKNCGGRLPPIEEKYSLEKQFMDLEEEHEEFKKKSEAKSLALEKEIKELKETILNSRFNCPSIDVAVQTDMRSECFVNYRQWNSSNSWWQSGDQPNEYDSDKKDSNKQCCCSCHKNYDDKFKKLNQQKLQLQADCRKLSRNRDMLLKNVNNLQPRYHPVCEREMVQNLASRLHNQELFCHHLQSLLKYQQRKSEKALKESWDQYQNDLSSFRSNLKLTQDKLKEYMIINKNLMDRLTKSDILIKDLYVENGQLIATCHKLEQHSSVQKSVETYS